MNADPAIRRRDAKMIEKTSMSNKEIHREIWTPFLDQLEKTKLVKIADTDKRNICRTISFKINVDLRPNPLIEDDKDQMLLMRTILMQMSSSVLMPSSYSLQDIMVRKQNMSLF